jgi:hypothetical protein
VGQFVQQDEPAPLGRPFLRLGWEEHDRAEEAPGHGDAHLVAPAQGDGPVQSQFGGEAAQEVSPGGIADGRRLSGDAPEAERADQERCGHHDSAGSPEEQQPHGRGG